MIGPSAFPFSALVGQERLKLGLILNAVHPGIGGLLIRGPKGTGKSTAVYALASLLPERATVSDCAYGCAPNILSTLCSDCRTRVANGEDLPVAQQPVRVVSLPLSASEDRVVGAVDVDRLLTGGEKAFRPGLLAEANQNFLYVDEINLLPDHLTDDILDAAASGWHTVEREGFSLTHPARFMLVGTMNPEEGDLRPQLLDRLPLSVQVDTIRNAAQRVTIAKHNLAFSSDPEGFCESFAERDAQVRSGIVAARERLPEIGLPDYQLEAVAEMCVALNVDGQRPEIAIAHTAMAIAAFRKRETVDEADLYEASEFALAHRTRDGGFEPPATREDIGTALGQALKAREGEGAHSELIRLTGTKAQATTQKKKRVIAVQNENVSDAPIGLNLEGEQADDGGKRPGRFDRLLISARDVMAAMKGAFGQLKLQMGWRSRQRMQPGVGRRASAYRSESRGRAVRHAALQSRSVENLAVLPSVLTSVIRQGVQTPIRLSRNDLRAWVREGKAPLHMVLIVDASASTFHFVDPTAKIISVLYRDAYRNRDKLGLVAIQDGIPKIINHPSRNLRAVLGNLTRLEPSGHTPLAEAMTLALNAFQQEHRRDPGLNPLAVLLSDCHPEPVYASDGNLMSAPPYLQAMHTARLFWQARVPIAVINPAHGTFKDGTRWWGTELAMRIARLSGGRYYGIPHNRYQKDAGMIQRVFERRDMAMDAQAIAQLLRDFRQRPTDESMRPGRIA